jgi:hypothetical protein
MLNRLTAAFVLTLATPLVASAQVAPTYAPGVYQQQPPQPAPYPQPQYPQQQAQPSPFAQQPYPQPGAAMQPGYGPPPTGLATAGYPGPGMYGAEPVVSSVEGLLQLSLGTYFVRYTSASLGFDNSAADLTRTDLNWGFSSSSPVILEGGYGITDKLIVGGVLQLGGVSSTNEAKMGGAKSETSGFDLLLAPKVDYQFMPTSKINPFVGGMLGVELNSASTTPMGATTSVKDSTTNFTLLARGGLRCFVFDGLSIDPALVLGFRIGSGTIGASGTDLNYSTSGFRIGLSVSMSGWLKI